MMGIDQIFPTGGMEKNLVLWLKMGASHHMLIVSVCIRPIDKSFL